MMHSGQTPSMTDRIRMIARSLAGNLASGRGSPSPSVNALFRLRSQWKAHGFYATPEAGDALGMLETAFGPSDDPDDRSFARGARHVVGCDQIEADGPATEADVAAFWKVVEELGRATGIQMPARTTPPIEKASAPDEDEERSATQDSIKRRWIAALLRECVCLRLENDPDGYRNYHTMRHEIDATVPATPEADLMLVGGRNPDEFYDLPIDVAKLVAGIDALLSDR